MNTKWESYIRKKTDFVRVRMEREVRRNLLSCSEGVEGNRSWIVSVDTRLSGVLGDCDENSPSDTLPGSR